MKQKRLLLLWALVLCALSVSAESITREQAREQAKQFLLQQGVKGVVSNADPLAALARRSQGGEAPCYYVFNVEQEQGFVIVSGDDLAPEVLGYADKGAIDMDHLPCSMQAWLESCEDQIRYLRQSGLSVRGPQATKSAISPIVKTTWDQLTPYNQSLPEYASGKKCATGCVATAMAQAMSVYKYPNATTAVIPSYTYKQGSTGQNKTVSKVNSGSTISWNNIRDSYTGSENATSKQAIAQLMLYCAASVETYLDQTSGAAVVDVPGALKKYFGYGNSVSYRYINDGYTAAQWDEMIYQEIAAGRPVILAGKVSSSVNSLGHAFICDGCDASGRYHINWGWSGDGNGYYLLNMLQPLTVGTGGTNGAYIYHQEAVIGISTAGSGGSTTEETPYLTVTEFSLGSTIETFEAVTVNGVPSYGPLEFKMSLANRFSNTYSFDLNIGVWKDDTFQEYLFDDVQMVTLPDMLSGASGTWSGGGMYKPGNSTSKCFRLPGTYVLKPVSRKKGTTQWYLCAGADSHYLTAVVSSSNTLSFSAAGSTTPVDPNGEVSSQERAALAQSLENSQTIQEGIMATIADYEEKLFEQEQRIYQAKDLCAETQERYSAMKEKATLYEQNSFLTTIDYALSSINDYVLSYLETAESRNTSGIVSCGSYKRSLEQIKARFDDCAARLNQMKTKGEYDQLVKDIVSTESWLNDMLGVTSVGQTLQEAETYLSVAENNLNSVASSCSALESALNEEIDSMDENLRRQYEERSEAIALRAGLQEKVESREAEIQQLKGELIDLKKMLDEAETVQRLELFADYGTQFIEKLDVTAPLLTKVSEILPKEDFDALYQRFMTIFESFNSVETLSSGLPDWSSTVTQVDSLTESLKANIHDAATMEEIVACQQALEELDSLISVFRTQVQDVVRIESLFVESLPERNETLIALNAQLDELNAELENVTTRLEPVIGNRQVVSCRDVSGRQASPSQKGFVILQFSDGTIKKKYNK